MDEPAFRARSIAEGELVIRSEPIMNNPIHGFHLDTFVVSFQQYRVNLTLDEALAELERRHRGGPRP